MNDPMQFTPQGREPQKTAANDFLGAEICRREQRRALPLDPDYSDVLCWVIEESVRHLPHIETLQFDIPPDIHALAGDSERALDMTIERMQQTLCACRAEMIEGNLSIENAGSLLDAEEYLQEALMLALFEELKGLNRLIGAAGGAATLPAELVDHASAALTAVRCVRELPNWLFELGSALENNPASVVRLDESVASVLKDCLEIAGPFMAGDSSDAVRPSAEGEDEQEPAFPIPELTSWQREGEGKALPHMLDADAQRTDDNEEQWPEPDADEVVTESPAAQFRRCRRLLERNSITARLALAIFDNEDDLKQALLCFALSALDESAKGSESFRDLRGQYRPEIEVAVQRAMELSEACDYLLDGGLDTLDQLHDFAQGIKY